MVDEAWYQGHTGGKTKGELQRYSLSLDMGRSEPRFEDSVF